MHTNCSNFVMLPEAYEGKPNACHNDKTIQVCTTLECSITYVSVPPLIKHLAVTFSDIFLASEISAETSGISNIRSNVWMARGTIEMMASVSPIE